MADQSKIRSFSIIASSSQAPYSSPRPAGQGSSIPLLVLSSSDPLALGSELVNPLTEVFVS